MTATGEMARETERQRQRGRDEGGGGRGASGPALARSPPVMPESGRGLCSLGSEAASPSEVPSPPPLLTGAGPSFHRHRQT